MNDFASTLGAESQGQLKDFYDQGKKSPTQSALERRRKRRSMPATDPASGEVSEMEDSEQDMVPAMFTRR